MSNSYFKAFALLIVISIVSCKNNTKEIQLPAKVPVTEVLARNIALDNDYVADIQAVRNVEIRSNVSGFLEDIYVDEGSSVKKGQLLFKIKDVEYKAEVNKTKALLSLAKAEAKTTELEVARVQQLYDKNIVSKSEVEIAKAKFKAANAKIEEADANYQNAIHRLSYTSVRAPFDGIIDRFPLRQGSLLAEGALLTTISDISSVYAYFNISENEYLELKSDSVKSTGKETVSLVLADGTLFSHKGKIETTAGEFDKNTGSIAVRAKFPNPDHILKHQATGKIKLTTKSNSVLLVPQKSSFEIQDKNFVYVLGKDNKVKMRSFQILGRYEQYFIVSAGLSSGEKIVFEGILNIKDGMKISPEYIHTTGAMVSR